MYSFLSTIIDPIFTAELIIQPANLVLQGNEKCMREQHLCPINAIHFGKVSKSEVQHLSARIKTVNHSQDHVICIALM